MISPIRVGWSWELIFIIEFFVATKNLYLCIYIIVPNSSVFTQKSTLVSQHSSSWCNFSLHQRGWMCLHNICRIQKQATRSSLKLDQETKCSQFWSRLTFMPQLEKTRVVRDIYVALFYFVPYKYPVVAPPGVGGKLKCSLCNIHLGIHIFFFSSSFFTSTSFKP